MFRIASGVAPPPSCRTLFRVLCVVPRLVLTNWPSEKSYVAGLEKVDLAHSVVASNTLESNAFRSWLDLGKRNWVVCQPA